MAQNTGLLPKVITGNVSINNGEPLPGRLTITQEWTRVRSERATKPDPSWTFTDDAGHWHAFAESTKDGMAADLPTLDRETIQMPCDGSCGGTCGGEGYSVPRFTCRACGQVVEPRWIPDVEAQTVGTLIEGLKDWMLEVENFDRSLHYQGDEQLSIRMDADADTFFGFGYATDHTMTDGGFEGFHATVTIYSGGPLGKRLT
jgi:hypothetical protein